jgi:hypothetical protein
MEMTTLDELERLLKAGTPEPWERALNVVIAGSERVAFVWRDEDGQYSAANAALIVAAINALPGLIESARRAEEMRAALEVADKGLRAGIEQYASRSFTGSVVAADEQYPWVSQMMQASHTARAALAKDATHKGTPMLIDGDERTTVRIFTPYAKDATIETKP